MVSIAALPKYEAYKNSQIEKIGYIPDSWDVMKLKFMASINSETLPDNTPSKYLLDYVDIGSVSFEHGIEKVESFLFKDAPSRARRKARPGDVVVSTVRTYLKAIAHIDGAASKYIYSTGFAVVSPKQKLISAYLGYFVKSNAFTEQVDLIAKGMSYPAINATELSNLYLVCAPSNDQTLIANFLDKKTTQIDEAIAIKEQQIALLKERKQIIIQKAVTQGLDPNVPMKDSGVDWVGKIPAHWEMKRVKNIFRLVMEPSEKNNDHELLSVYTDIGVKPRRELEERGNKASTTDGYWFVKKGDIVVNKLLAWMGAIGLSEYDGVTSPAYDILRPQLPVNGHFYHYLFRSGFCSAELKRHSRGIMDMRLRLYFDKFGVIEVPYPPLSEQNEIIHSLEVQMKDMDKGVEYLNIQIEKLKEYKTTLINSAVTGKIKVTPEMAGLECNSQDAVEA